MPKGKILQQVTARTADDGNTFQVVLDLEFPVGHAVQAGCVLLDVAFIEGDSAGVIGV